jgi:hypothetical protein
MRHHALESDNESNYLRQDALEAVFFMANSRRKTIARIRRAMAK